MPTRDEAWPDGTPSWVDCQVDDLGVARKFYSDLFGWDIQDGPQQYGGYLMCMYQGRAVAGIGPKPEGAQMPSVWSTYFATSDVDAFATKVTQAGGQLFMPPFDVGTVGRMTFGMDTAGAAFGLWQPKEHNGIGVFNEPNTLCWNELHTTEYQSSQDFYTAVFGFSYDEIGDGQQFTYSVFKRPSDGEGVGGFSLDTDKPEGVPNYWLTWFAVADADAAVAKATELGSQVLMPPMDSPFGRMAVISGSQGEVLGLIDMSKAAAQQ